jgi:gliding motility-associated-like protein
MHRKFFVFLVLFFLCNSLQLAAQCGGILEPGFAFLTSSRGCAPFSVSIQTLYLSSVPGTTYYVTWGDGTPEETYVQVGATGVTMTHLYPNTSINCGYDVTIDASNACNPRGSVVPINTQVVVWTNDVISITPATYRVCQGYAASVTFTDDSDWNCFPRATRENNEPRWIQWLYGTGPLANQIPGVTVNSILPGGFPYLDPAPARNPIYPVVSPGQVSLPLQVPAAPPADLGKEFEITLKNWNQCNAYDNNLLNGPLNPADLINGDNPPQVTTARIVIVPAPQPDFLTRLGGAGGPIQTVFCVGDNIYFDNETPPIGGAAFQYTWQFYDNSTGTGAPLATRTNTNPTFSYATSGQKLVRLSVRDANAAGSCIAVIEKLITISPSLIAAIQTTDLAGNPITPYFCQSATAPFSTFQVRFADVSAGVATATTQWRWEFFDEAGVLVRQEPGGGGFSTVALGPFVIDYTNRGIYRTRLVIRDNITSCETQAEAFVRVYENPQPAFTASRVCEGTPVLFTESSTLNAINGESIVLREWDFNYDGTFDKNPAFDNQTSFSRSLGAAGTYQVALRVVTNQHACEALLVVPVTVDPLPNASFVPDRTSGCSVLTVNFTNQSVAGQPAPVDRFIWEKNEGAGYLPFATQHPSDSDFSDTLTATFENVGTSNKVISVRLRAVSIFSCETISTPVDITVFPGTASGFISLNYSPFNNNCSPVSVNFSVDSQTQSLNPTDYRWRVADGTTVLSDVSTGATPVYTHQFVNTTQALKDFSITLTTTLPSACFGDSTRTIRVSPVPDSDFTIDTLAYTCQHLRMRFSAVQKGLSQYDWSISENGVVVFSSTTSGDVLEREFSRSAAQDIVVSVSLTTRNFANCTSAATVRSFTSPQVDGINAAFTATPLNQTLPASTVSVAATNPGPWQYEWDFGDGTRATGPISAQHTYTTFGIFRITLTVRNNDCVDSETQAVTIQAIPPVVDFDYDPASGCVPLTVNFTNKTRFADADKYEWSFGDGQAISRAVNPRYTYFEPGKYSVTLTATNATSQVARVTKLLIIEVLPKPDAQFEVKPRLITATDGILYTSNRSFGASRFLWDFGDGNSSSVAEPTHIYKSEGEYTITLVAYNNFDCADTAQLVGGVRVKRGGQILVPNAFSPSLLGSGGSSSGGGEGKNDVFLPLMRGVVEFEMQVFNRWGELLFMSRSPEQGWDGYYQGRLCQQDVYVYRIAATYESGEKVVRVGDINLIR